MLNFSYHQKPFQTVFSPKASFPETHLCWHTILKFIQHYRPHTCMREGTLPFYYQCYHLICQKYPEYIYRMCTMSIHDITMLQSLAHAAHTWLTFEVQPWCDTFPLLFHQHITITWTDYNFLHIQYNWKKQFTRSCTLSFWDISHPSCANNANHMNTNSTFWA